MAKPGDQWSAAFAGASTSAMQVYDEIIAMMFMPWARDIVDRVEPLEGRVALDVACGPGTVTRVLAARAGSLGRVIATDISRAMLDIARSKPVESEWASIEWVESPASPLAVPDGVSDVVTCQQGLQFFPDKEPALTEIRRALRDGGRAVISCWTSIEEQPPFSALRDAIAAVVSSDLAERYIGPWSLSGDEMASLAHKAGFDDVRLERVTLPGESGGGATGLIRTLVASGIATDIAALDEDMQKALEEEVRRRVASIDHDGVLRFTLTSSVMTLA